MSCKIRGCVWPEEPECDGYCIHHWRMFGEAEKTPHSAIPVGERIAQRRLSAPQKKRMKSLYREGYSIRGTAKNMKVTRQTVQRQFRRLLQRYGPARCPCGLPATHTGRCRARRRRKV